MWRYVFALMGGFFAASAMAEGIDFGGYFSSLPEGGVSVGYGKKYWVVSYCPDNTCDLLYISTSVKEVEAKRLVLGYFVYFSEYTYLSRWQEEARKNEVVQSELQLLSINACQSLGNKSLVECRLKRLSVEKKLKIFAVRFDEGKKTTTRQRLSDVFHGSE